MPKQESKRSILFPPLTIDFIFIASAIFLGSICYLNTFASPFVFDDYRNILENKHLRINEVSIKTLYASASQAPTKNRPVAFITFALNHYLHQYRVFGYHLTNLIIHLFTGILVFYLFKKTLFLSNEKKYDQAQRWLALVASIFWIVHPVNVETVTYIVQRMTELAVFFYVASLLAYIGWRLADSRRDKIVYLLSCIIFGLFSIGSKEIAITLPFFIILYEWYFFQNSNPKWIINKGYLIFTIFMIGCLIGFFYLGFDPVQCILSGYKSRHFSLPQRLLTEFRVVVFYLSLIILPYPSRLNINHSIPLSYSLFNPITTLFSVIFISSMLVCGLYTRKKNKLLSFSIFWFFGNLILESSLIGLELAFEHRLYLPSLFLILIVVNILNRIISKNSIKVGLALGILSVFSIFTIQRNHVWQSEITLWKDSVEKSPGLMRPYYNLALALTKNGESEKAISYYRKAAEIEPGLYKIHNQLGLLYFKEGKIKDAIASYKNAIKVNPHSEDAYINLGNVYLKIRSYQQSIALFNEAIKINPNNAKAYYNMGTAFIYAQEPKMAVASFTRAIEINPNYTTAHNNLGAAFEQIGKLSDAKYHYLEAIRLNPDFKNAQSNLQALELKIQNHTN